MGIPFLAVRGLLHSDILKHRPDLQVQDNPFHPSEQVVIAQPIRPDIAVFHALTADRFGNAITPGPRDDVMLARAAKHVIVTAEEISPGILTAEDARRNTFLSALDVDAVSHVPLGAHPCGFGTLYDNDAAHCQEYLHAARSEADFQAYLERYVYGVDNHQDYLACVDANQQRQTA